MIQHNSRRFFIKTMILGGLAVHFPFVFSCNTEDTERIFIEIDGQKYSLTTSNLRPLLDILLPNSPLGPGALALKSDIFFLWTINDQLLSPAYRIQLINDFDSFNEYIKTQSSKDFSNISIKDQSEMVEKWSKTKKGRKHIAELMTIIVESMFANPVYGSNPDHIGEKWLNQNPGFPQPTAKNKYPEIQRA